MKIAGILLCIAIFASLLVGGCTDQIADPVKTDVVAGAPEIPKNIQSRVGDAEVELTWEVTNPGALQRYFIYRGDATVLTIDVIDSTTQTTYIDRGARNGTRYFYQIAAQGTNGLIGKRSELIIATPGLFSISINGGEKFATSSEVTVSSAAPSGTSYILLTNDTTSASAEWLTFQIERNWSLEPGDGPRKVFAKFRDSDGNETKIYSIDDIIVDTKATIDSVTESSGGAVLSAGDLLHLAIYTKEINGIASADIPGVGTVQLFDDGSSGDQTAADGVYELNYTIPAAVDILDELITGDFGDEAGNRADSKVTATFLTIANPPVAAQLTAYVISETEVRLMWSRSEVSDFASYLLFRSETADVDSADLLLKSETVAGNTNFSDTDLEPATSYYYVVYTQDQSGLKAASNVIKATTKQNDAPAAVQLFVSGKTATSVSLGWTKNNDDDFASYSVYRSTSAGVQRTAANLKGVVTSQNLTSFTDSDVEAEATYYYVVVVYDRFDKPSSLSNEVTVTTPASGI